MTTTELGSIASGERLGPPSRCERCRGVFNLESWSPARNDACSSCGAGRHWEAKTKQVSPPAHQYPRRGDGGFRLCFTCGERREIRRGFVCCAGCRANPPRHLPDARFECGDAWNIERFATGEEHDRFPSVFALWRLVATPPRWDCLACRGTGRIKDRHHFLQIERTVGTEAEGAPRRDYASADDLDPVKLAERDFLSSGGWSIQTIASSGAPVGRPTEGILDEAELIAAINLGLQDPAQRARVNAAYGKSGRSGLRALREELIRGVAPPDRNTQTIADLFGISRKAAQNLVRSLNSAKEGEMFKPSSVDIEDKEAA